MEYAISSLMKKIEAARLKRVSSSFKELKKLSRFTEFELNSKKIFYKIGFATLIVLSHKLKYRNLGLGFKAISEAQQNKIENQKREFYMDFQH